jgi:deoxyribodipyrimidine photo-lyase
MKNDRSRIIREGKSLRGPVVYWMSRDQRVRDNWALLFAQEHALQRKSALIVVFCLVPEFLNAAIRQYGFMLRGLREVEETLAKKNIPFFLIKGKPEQAIPLFLNEVRACALAADFDPLRVKRAWIERVSKKISIPVYQVDAHNIVPCWTASSRQEYAAYTFRPKIRKLLPRYLEPFPSVKKHPCSFRTESGGTDWRSVIKALKADRAVPEVSWLTPGEKAAGKVLRGFINNRLKGYARDRNDPVKDGQSDLSPYLHFGQISAATVARSVRESEADHSSKEAFLEELIVRRELSDNFCFYNDHYDSFNGFPAWAKESLAQHRQDRREYVYTWKQFEASDTHDALWNAAQREMVVRGKMHGYMRMYWAKKILEWSASPDAAIEIAIYLNDRYELDGRDPNGYAGIAWSIGGVHDRAWNKRRIFGKVRYMSLAGCRSKFDVDAYIQYVKTVSNKR